MTPPKKIVIDDQTYVPQAPAASGDVKIAVLQRGWVAVGRWSRDGDNCALDNAFVIRVWGTTKGLGELRSGPTSTTKLDPAGRIEFHILTMVFSIDCEDGKWSL